MSITVGSVYTFYIYNTIVYKFLIPFGESLNNLVKLNFFAKVRGFAKLCTSTPNRHVISGIKKPQKERLTSRPR